MLKKRNWLVSRTLMLAILLIMASFAWAANGVKPGELIIDPPTLISLGFAWQIDGDDNRNALASITYRKKGAADWSRGLDLLRLQNEETFMRGALDYTAPNMFAGSLFDLEENTEYEVRLEQLTPMSNVHLRNNLLLGQGTTPRVLSVDAFTNYSSSDYNGFRPNPESKEAFAWNSPPFEKMRDFYPARRTDQNASITLTQRIFPTLESYSKETGQDRHSRIVDFDIFVHVPKPDFSDPTRVIAPESIDLRLREGAAAIDAGIELPNVTDGFQGKAPDLGAYEFGVPLPHYGPRTKDEKR